MKIHKFKQTNEKLNVTLLPVYKPFNQTVLPKKACLISGYLSDDVEWTNLDKLEAKWI